MWMNPFLQLGIYKSPEIKPKEQYLSKAEVLEDKETLPWPTIYITVSPYVLDQKTMVKIYLR